jgi:hypothetical protein
MDPFEHVDNHDFGCGGHISYYDTLQLACVYDGAI